MKPGSSRAGDASALLLCTAADKQNILSAAALRLPTVLLLLAPLQHLHHIAGNESTNSSAKRAELLHPARV